MDLLRRLGFGQPKTPATDETFTERYATPGYKDTPVPALTPNERVIHLITNFLSDEELFEIAKVFRQKGFRTTESGILNKKFKHSNILYVPGGRDIARQIREEIKKRSNGRVDLEIEEEPDILANGDMGYIVHLAHDIRGKL